MITLKNSGNFAKTETFLKKKLSSKSNIMAILERYGDRGVDLLTDATPYDTGLTAYSWDYEIEENRGEYKLHFTNDNIVDGVNIAIILQYGHGTKNGGYVVGQDYINPAVRQAFDEMRDELIREVRRS